MPRTRYIKHDLYLDDKLAACSLVARYIFPGLWIIADREGRLEDNPRKIGAMLLPYDKANINALLDELAQGGFLLRYTIEGRGYIQIVNFSKHQRPHLKEAASTIPPHSPTRAEKSRGKVGASTNLYAERSPIMGNGEWGMGNGEGEGTKTAKGGAIPTLEQVKAYCLERGNGVDPQRWFDFYCAKGWMIGKVKMRDWKAAVRTWERRDNDRRAGEAKPVPGKYDHLG